MKKTLLRTISFVLMCAEIFSAAPAAFAKSDDKNAQPQSAYGILYSMEITRDVDNPDENISRAEFCDMAAKLMNLDFPVYNAYYEDLPLSGDWAKSVYMLSELGIVSGTGEGRFEPEGFVTVNQAAAITVKALNWYSVLPKPVVYPTSYTIKAEQLGITKGLDISGESELSYEDARLIIYNALFAKVADIDTDGKLKKDSSALEAFHGLTENEGVCTANYITTLSGIKSTKCGKNQIEIDGKIHDVLCDDASEYIGQRIEYYADDNGDIIYIESDNRSTLTLDYEDVCDFKVSSIKYYENDKTKTEKIAAGADVIYNGVSYSEYKPSDFSFEDGNGTITLVDRDGSDGFDLIVIWEYISYVVNYADETNKTLYYLNYRTEGYDSAQEPVSRQISFEKADNVEIERTDGTVIPFSQLFINDAASVFESKDKSFVKIIVSPEKFYGAVTSVTDGELVITSQDGSEKEYDVECRDVVMKDALKLGYAGGFILNHKGAVCGIINYYDEDFKYGYIIATGFSSQSLDKTLEAKILCDDGNIKIFSLNNKTKIDGVRYSSLDDINAALQLYDGKADKYYTNQQLIRYKTASDNLSIIDIDTANVGPEESNDTSLEIVGFSDVEHRYRPNNRYVSRNLVVDVNGLVVFCVPRIFDSAVNASDIANADDDNYFVLYDLKGYHREEYIRLDAAVTDKDGGTSNIVILPAEYTPKREIGGNKSYKDRGTAATAIVESVGRASDADGTEVPTIRLIKDSEVISVLCKYEECVQKNVYDADGNVSVGSSALLQKGDAIVYYADNAGVIRYVNVIFDVSRVDNKRFSIPSEGVVSREMYSCGVVYSKSAKGMKMMRLRSEAPVFDRSDALAAFDPDDYAVQTLAETDTKYFVYDFEDKTVRKGTFYDIRDYVNNPGNPSVVCQRETYTIPGTIYIYN